MERRRMQKIDHHAEDLARVLQRRIHTAVCDVGLPGLQTIEVLSDYLNANVRGYNDYIAEQAQKSK
jgi:hypothetical protein